MAEDAGGQGHGQAPIIIKRKVVGEHGHHGGAWKVAYADMVTALMALFIVLWILAQSDEFKANIAHYFQDPVGFTEGGTPTPMPGGTRSGTPAILDDIQPEIPPESQETNVQVWRARATEIRVALEKLPAFDKYRKQIQISVTPEGLRINLLESSDTPIFKVGSTQLNDEAEALLLALGNEIQTYPNSMVIEGHTDSRPFESSSGMTNWELSTGRAHTARRVFEKTGLPAKRILEVRGFADRQLFNPADPEDSRNRRVSITLLSKESFTRRAKVPEETVIPWLSQ